MTDLKFYLEEIARYGEVILTCSSPKSDTPRKPIWWCKVDLFIAGVGMTASVRSEMSTHETPLAAAVECYTRLVELSRTAAQTLPTLEGGV